jgi:mannose-6-phosphate isomerase-like protein (cupin superfamily)/oxalate decarboxylase/phosphoglucose isomerase-like protein (cupin superfamily)
MATQTSTSAAKIFEQPDLKARRRYPYYRWMESEGIPIHFDVAGISDITAAPRKPWARTGSGLGTFLELAGTFQAERGMFVCEIPPGEALDVQHHLYEQFTLILQGRGATEVWQKNGPKRSFEWHKGSLFAPPKNTYYRMINVGREPVLYFGVTTAPRLFNGVFGGWGTGDQSEVAADQFEFVFNCDYEFANRYDGSEDYFNRTDNRVTSGRYNATIWYTNFIPDVSEEFVDNLEQKVAGGQLTGYRMAGGFPSGHISEWPVGRYHKAHYHGPGAVLVGLKGNGYVNLWPKELGIHPWQDGHADKVSLVQWGPNSIYVPPDGWFHQHMSTGKVPARHVAVYGGSIPLGSQRSGDEGGVYRPVREGGVLIEYEDEDPEVRRYFVEANRREGVECDMPPVTYRTDPFQLVY